MNTLIVAVDFSPASRNAANFAIDLASVIDADLLLFNAFSIPAAYSDGIPLMLISPTELEQKSDSKLMELKDHLTHIRPQVDITIKSSLGNTIDELDRLCRHVSPIAVVMGSTGEAGVEHILFGSTTLSAVKRLEVPVISVPRGKEFGKGIKKIGFACDFNDIDAIPVDAIIKLTKLFGAKLHIINVDHANKHFHYDTLSDSFILHQRFEDLKPEYHYLDNRDVEEGITAFAETYNLDLVIAVPKKHRLLDRIFRTAVTKQLIFQSHVPIMCVH